MSASSGAPSGGVGPAAALALAAALLGARDLVEAAHDLAGGRPEAQLAQGAGERPAQLLEVAVGQVADRGLAAGPRRDRHDEPSHPPTIPPGMSIAAYRRRRTERTRQPRRRRR